MTHMTNGKNILIVDDDAEFTPLLETRLKQAGYQVVVVHSGVEAVEMVRSVFPDLILLDLGLPDLSGDMVALIIQSERSRENSIPMIALTGHNDPMTRSTTQGFGFVDFIEKPYDPEDLLKRIEQAFS